MNAKDTKTPAEIAASLGKEDTEDLRLEIERRETIQATRAWEAHCKENCGRPGHSLDSSEYYAFMAGWVGRAVAAELEDR